MTMNKFMADVDDLIFDGQEMCIRDRFRMVWSPIRWA